MRTRRWLWLSLSLALVLLSLTASPALAQSAGDIVLPSGSGAPAQGAEAHTPLHSAAAIHYVKHDASGLNSGTSWTDAYTDLQDALAAATAGDEIWVAQGVYTPGTNAADTFQLVDGVALYGGFAGTPGSEGDASGRDWETYVTVLSGDIDGNDVTDANGVVTDTGDIAGANSYHVVTSSGVAASTNLDGFTITAGHAGSSAPNNSGGGLFNTDGSPTLSHLAFSGNYAGGGGGGMYTHRGRPALTDVTFTGNFAWAGGGGGMHSRHSVPVLIGVTFSHNSAIYEGGGVYTCEGGGMYIVGGGPSLTDVIFTNNEATGGGGGLRNQGDSSLTDVQFSDNTAGSGAGITHLSGNLTLIDVEFSNNEATGGGGGLYNQGDSSLTDVQFSDNTAGSGAGITNFGNLGLIDVEFSNNVAATDGGALYSEGGGVEMSNVLFAHNSAGGDGGAVVNIYATVAMTNVTMVDNAAGGGGGALFNAPDRSYSTISNGILWDNAPEQIAGFVEPTVSSSCVQGGWPGTGNVDVDPLFVDAAGGDLHLQPASPVINLGDNAAVPAGVATDLDGNPRILFGQVDMGAYEATATAPQFTSTPLEDAAEEQAYSYAITTTDLDDPTGARTITAPERPAWLTLTDHGDGAGTLSGMPAQADIGDHPVTLQVEDAGGYTDTQSFTITVANVNDAPTFTSTPVTSATEGALYTYAVQTDDVDAGDTRAITAPTKPAWLTLTDHGDGAATLSGTPGNDHVGSHAVTLQVEDAGGYTDTQSFTVVVANVNDAPTFTSTPPVAATVDVSYTYAVQTDDVDAGDTRTITAPAKPAWLTLTDHGDGAATLSGAPAAADIGDHPVTLQVEDAGGLGDTQSFTIAVQTDEMYVYLPAVSSP